MQDSRLSLRSKNRWQTKRQQRKALSERMNAAKARKRLAEPAPEYPPIIDRRVPFLRITVESAAGTENWLIYPGKRRAHGVTINGDLLVLGGRRRHSLSQITAEMRRRASRIEHGMRMHSP